MKRFKIYTSFKTDPFETDKTSFDLLAWGVQFISGGIIIRIPWSSINYIEEFTS